jgi:hypothetical protein
MVDDVDSASEEVKEKYEKLKIKCFDQLVFFLTQEEIRQLTGVIEQIDKTKSLDLHLKHFYKITQILQNSLRSGNKQIDALSLQNLYESFDNKSKIDEKVIPSTASQVRTFWHFNVLGEEQIKAFKDGRWFLSLIEYGEEWRTNLLQQVKPDDVIFLFKRGGAGYIGAFQALNPPAKIIKPEEGGYTPEDVKKYDIYNAVEDGATYVSCIRVEPLAYNFKGVGYWTVRRRTIERINDTAAVKYLINGFNGIFTESGNKEDMERRYREGNGKLDETTEVKNLNTKSFEDITASVN